MGFRNIIIPDEILQNSNFNKKIVEICELAYSQVEYLRQIIDQSHQIYGDLAKSVSKLTQETQKRISPQYQPFWINSFFKNINSIYLNILHKVNNNVVILKSKHNKLARKRMDLLMQKVMKVDEQMKKYLQLVQSYNKDGLSYVNDCEYFSDWQNNPIKYYSLNQAANKYSKINKKEYDLRRKLENVYKMKKQLLTMIRQIRVSIKDYYQLLSLNLNDYKKLSLVLRDKPISKLYNQPIIQEVNQEAQNSLIQRDRQFSTSHNNNSYFNIRQSPYPAKQISFQTRRKQLQKQYSRESYVCSLLLSYIEQLNDLNIKAEKKLQGLLESNQYKKFEMNNQQLSEYNQEDMQENKNICLKEIKNFKKLFNEVVGLLNKIKLFKQINKNRDSNCDKFIQESQLILQNQKNQKKVQYEKIQEKYNTIINEEMKLFRQKSLQLWQEIAKKFDFKKSDTSNKPKNKDINIFTQNYFKILVLPFFTQKSQEPQFYQSQHIRNYLRIINANKLEQISMELQSDVRDDEQRQRTTCCGLVKIKDNKRNNNVDSYSCALKIGLILIQGQLKIFHSHIQFSTLAITNLFMGSTQLRIPRQDILIAVKERYIAMMIVIKTTHGSIQFTSFLTDPYEKLLEIIPSHKRQYPKLQIVSCNNMKLKDLEQHFQSYFRNLIEHQNIIINNLQTFLSQSTKQLTITSQYNLKYQVEEKGFFEIKLRKLKSAIQYSSKFSTNTSKQVKKYINDAVKELIEAKEDIKDQRKKQGVFDFKNISDIAQKDLKDLFLQRSLSQIKLRKSNEFNSNNFIDDLASNQSQIPKQHKYTLESLKNPKLQQSKQEKSLEIQEKKRINYSQKKLNNQSLILNEVKSDDEQREIRPNSNRFMTQGNTLSLSHYSSSENEQKNKAKQKTPQFQRIEKYSTDDQQKFYKVVDSKNKKQSKKQYNKATPQQTNEINPLIIIAALILFFTLLSHSV